MQFSHNNEPIELRNSQKHIQTTDNVHHPPISDFKSRSFKAIDNDLENSFSQNIQQAHIQAVWNSSIRYLEDSFFINIDTSLGMNDPQIFQDLVFETDTKYHEEDLTIEKIMASCHMLSSDEKNQLIADLSKERDLVKFIAGLYHKFHPKIFSQILMVIKVAWQQYLMYKKKKQMPKQWDKFFAPRLFELSQQNIQNYQKQPMYIQDSPQALAHAADDATDRINRELYISANINYINLRETDVSKKQDRIISEIFKQFIKSIFRGVFMCIEGCFSTDINGEESVLGSLIAASSRDILQEQSFFSFGEIRKISSWK